MTDRYSADLLEEAIRALPEAVAIFDAEDRFVLWNGRFSEIYGRSNPIECGMRFGDHLRACVANGLVPDARGREEEWIAERLKRFAAADGVHEHRLADGRCVRVQERHLACGGRIGIRSDVTAVADRERDALALLEANPAPVIVSDVATLRVLWVNQAAVHFYGYERTAFLALRVGDYRVEDRPGDIEATILSVGTPEFDAVARVHRTASGQHRVVKVTASRIVFEGRDAVVAAITDVTELQLMQDEVRHARDFLRQIIDQVPTAVFAKDMAAGGRFVVYNKACESLFGRSRADALGSTDRDVFGAQDAARFAVQDEVAMRLGALQTVEDEAVGRPDGDVRHVRTRKVALDEGGRRRFVVGVCEDVTDRRASEARMAHMAHHDALTNLPNRFLLRDRLGSALARTVDARESLAVLCIDLDGFKAVNDTWGHAVGDRLLEIVADRLRSALRDCDTAARFGGDEFVVLQTPVTDPAEAATLAGRLIEVLRKPYMVDGRRVSVSASIGIAVARSRREEPTALLDSADEALYRAKRGGRNTFRFARGLALEQAGSTSGDHEQRSSLELSDSLG